MATKEQILEYLSAPRSDKDIASAMVEHRVTPDQLQAAIGKGGPSVQEITQRFQAALPDVNPYSFISEAVASPKVTAQQYQDLSNYFSNTNVGQDTNQQRDFINNKTGYEMLNYLMTRDAVQGGGNRDEQSRLFQQAIQPFMGTQINFGVRDVYDSETGNITGQERYATDPVTGLEKVLTPYDEGRQLYKMGYGELGRASTDPAETGYFPQVVYQLNPETGGATIVGGGPDRAFVGDGFADFAKLLASTYISLNGIPGLPSTGGPISAVAGVIRDTKDYFDYTGNKQDLNQTYQQRLQQEELERQRQIEERRAGLASLFPRPIPLSQV